MEANSKIKDDSPPVRSLMDDGLLSRKLPADVGLLPSKIRLRSGILLRRRLCGKDGRLLTLRIPKSVKERPIKNRIAAENRLRPETRPSIGNRPE